MKWTLLLLMLSAAAAQPQQDDHAHHLASAPPGNAQIVVTINPEARPSAVIAAPMPPPLKCGEAVELEVHIVNQGFVTAPLRANIVGDSKSRVALHMDARKLSGAPEETRILHFIPLWAGQTDVTLAFNIDNNAGDLGGRDRVHLLVRCV